MTSDLMITDDIWINKFSKLERSISYFNELGNRWNERNFVAKRIRSYDRIKNIQCQAKRVWGT